MIMMSFDEISNTNLGLSLDLGLGFHEHHHQQENFMKKKEVNDPSKCNFNKSYALSLTLGPIIIDDDDDQQQEEASKIEASWNYSPSDGVSNNSFFNNNSSSIIKKENSEEFEVEVEDIEDENPRKKLRLTKEQSTILEDNFKEHSTINPKQKQELAKKLNLRARQVEVWFQNRRARTKLKQTESECEILRKCCKTLTEENMELQKELQELRSIQTTVPFNYMNMIPAAATLTICPCCERNNIIHASSSSSSSTPNTTTFLISGSNNHNHNNYYDHLYKSNNYPFSHPSSSPTC